MTITFDPHLAAALVMATTAIVIAVRERVNEARLDRHMRQAVRVGNRGRQ